MKKYSLFFVLTFCITFLSFAEQTTVLLEGTIGKAHIVMELSVSDQSVSARYFYKKFKQSLSLEGKWQDDKTLMLQLEPWGDVRETFLIKDVGTTLFHFTGTWTSNGTTLPVSLTGLDPAKIVVKNTWVKQMKIPDFNFVRLCDMEIKKDSIQKLSDEISITWYHDSLTKFSSFQINPVAALKGIDSANRWQQQFHMAQVLSYLDCGESGRPGTEYSSGIESVYVRGHVLSLCLSSSYDCGGAHPDFSTDGFTINLETGGFLSVTDFIYFRVPEARQENYMSDVFAPNVVTILTRLYPNEMKPGGSDELECDYSDPGVWDYCSWYLTKDGLRLNAYFYRAARHCDADPFSVIPYSELKKYKNPAAQIPMQY